MSKTLENAFVFVATLAMFCAVLTSFADPLVSAKWAALLVVGCVAGGFLLFDTRLHWSMSLVGAALLGLWALAFRAGHGADMFQYWTLGLAAIAFFFFLASRAHSTKAWLQWGLIGASVVQIVAIVGSPWLWAEPSSGGLVGNAEAASVLFAALALWIFEDDENPVFLRFAGLIGGLVLAAVLQCWGTGLLLLVLPLSIRVWRALGALGFFVIASTVGFLVGLWIQHSAGGALMGHAFVSLMGLEMVGQSPIYGGGLLRFASDSFEVGQKLLLYDPRFLEIFGSQVTLPSDPQNLVLATAVATGLLGLLLLAVVAFSTFGRLGTVRDQGLKAALMFWLLKSLYTAILCHPSTLFLGAALLGVLQKEDDELMPQAHSDRLPVAARLAFVPFAMLLMVGSWSYVRDELSLGHLQRSLANQNWAGALESSSQLLSHGARTSSARLGRATASFESGHLDQMAQDLATALSESSNLVTLSGSGELYMRAKMWTEAYAVNSQILNVYPRHLPTAARLAEIAQQRGDLMAARVWAERLKASHIEADQKLSQSILDRQRIGF
jgi:hypothetical protein